MNEQEIERLLQLHDIRPTAVRILIWKTISNLNFAFALADIESAMPTLDRSTIFRSLSVFSEQGLLHTLSDGSGQHKYCICTSCHDNSLHNCNHVHMKCTKCGKTFCLKDVPIPQVAIPQGFQVERITYLVEGVCPHCGHIDIDGRRPECCCHNN